MENPKNYKEIFQVGQKVFWVGNRETDLSYHMREAEVFEVFDNSVKVKLWDRRFNEFGEGKKISKVNIQKLFVNKQEAIEAGIKNSQAIIKTFMSIVEKEQKEIERLNSMKSDT